MVLFTVFTAQAQEGKLSGAEEASKAKAKTFQKEFGLSDKQYTKTYDVLLESSKTTTEKMSAMRDGGSFDRDEYMDTMTGLQEDRDKKLKAIFTDTQWVAYEKWKKDNPPTRGGHD